MKGISSKLIPIGRFAEASRLSLKALRLYDSMGLLSPAHVDEDSGYRYYLEEQLAQAKLIALLRRLKMPLASIQQVLAAPPERRGELVDTYWREVESWMSEGRRIVGYVYAHLQGREAIMGYQVQSRDLPRQQVLSISREVTIGDLPSYIGDSMRRLVDYARSRGSDIAAAPMAIYHGEVNADSNGPVEICVPFSGRLNGEDDITVKELAATPAAATTLTPRECQFPEILGAYDALYDWIKARGHRPAAPPREIYFASSDDVGPDDPFVDVAWPYQ